MRSSAQGLCLRWQQLSVQESLSSLATASPPRRRSSPMSGISHSRNLVVSCSRKQIFHLLVGIFHHHCVTDMSACCLCQKHSIRRTMAKATLPVHLVGQVVKSDKRCLQAVDLVQGFNAMPFCCKQDSQQQECIPTLAAFFRCPQGNAQHCTTQHVSKDSQGAVIAFEPSVTAF